MMTIIFFVLFFMIFGKLIKIAFKLTWGIMKVALYFVFHPLIIVGLVFKGLLIIALPVLLVVGLFGFLAEA